MIAARVLLSLSLLTGAAAVPAGRGRAVPRQPACDPGWCRLMRPTVAELDAIVGEAERLLARYDGDSTALGQACHALGATMRARAGDVRIVEYMWRAPDLMGHLAAVTGDAHRVEPGAGSGLVHIARGYDPLNPDRGLAAIVQTARHEFAHLNGWGQVEGFGADEAAQVATACGAP